MAHKESLHVKKLMHSLMSLSSPVPEFGAEAKRNCFKQTKASHNNVFPGMSTV